MSHEDVGQKYRFWLLTIGEPLPIDAGTPRLFRAGMLAKELASRGHDVTWWTSAFNHSEKVFRAGDVVELAPNYRLRLLRGCGYRRNISLARLRDHRMLAAEFKRLASESRLPDAVHASYPTAELCLAAEDLCKPSGIPVAVDMRDQWPDIFLDVLPTGLRWMGRLALWRMFKNARMACEGAHSILGMTQGFVDYGLKHAGRKQRADDRVFRMGYSAQAPDAEEVVAADAFWDSLLPPLSEALTICFFGAVGPQFDFETVLRAADTLGPKKVRFALCGSGDALDDLRARASGSPNVIFPGWIDSPKIWTLMRRSHLGLAPYRLTPNYEPNIPNKPAEYLSAGLPILTSLWRGALHDLTSERDCGLFYEEGDVVGLCRQIEHYRDNRELQATMSANALALYEKEFRADKVYAAMADYMESLAAKSGNLVR